MGCGCSKKNNVRSRNVIRPTAASNTNSRIVSASTQLRAQSLNTTGLTAEKRKTQAVRRAAIRRGLNK